MEYDTEDSRVFLGPFQSPEKKYLAAPATPSPLPLRRSPRLSSPVPVPQYESEDDDLSHSTPEHDPWQQDEPSSALASRISRAHDNPSPPPGLDLDSVPPTPPEAYPAQPIPFIVSNSPSRGGSPFSPRPQRDLISFDSFSASPKLLPTEPVASTSFIPPQTHAPTVDDLLSTWSPSAQEAPVSPAPSDPNGGKENGRSSQQSTPDLEEQAVVAALTVPEASDPEPTSSRDDSDAQPAGEAAPHTPLRRSSRPRRSGTPHAHLVPLPSSDDESPARIMPLTKKRRKGKERETLAVNENDDSQSGANMPTESEEGEKRKRKGNSAFQRQLGSLSPGSVHLLSQLLPVPTTPPAHDPQTTYSFPVFPDAPPATAIASPPIRASPARSARARSPKRIQFQAASLDDPSRTPARRIPVTEAVARGQISPQKAAHLLAPSADTGPVSRTPIFHIPAQDTPARRVHLAPPPASQGKWQGIRFGSPTRSTSPERGGSAEPRARWNASTAGPSDQKASTSRSSPSRTISSPIKKGKLPFSLTPSSSESVVPPIPEDKTSGALPEQPVPPTSPVLSIIKIPRSNLKQPTSRIPRIGAKPYARPATKSAGSEKATKPAVSDKIAKPPPIPPRKAPETAKIPPRIAKVVRTASGSSLDDTKTATVEAGPSSLKRKRPASPPAKQRPVVLRQVVSTKPPPKSVAAPIAPSPVKRAPVTKFRMVDLHARPADADLVTEPPPQEPELPRSPSPTSPVKRTPAAKFRMVDLHPPAPEPVAEPHSPEPEVSRPLPPSSPIVVSSPEPPNVPLPPSPPPPVDAFDAPEEFVRRTTRVRKPVFPGAGAGVGVAPQGLSSRRKMTPAPGGGGPFASMSAVALKALTSLNTTKNQRYLAAKLETEVVRRDGDRPESPVMKIKTIAQREQEMKGARRKERALRRARRTEDGGASENEALSEGNTSTEMDSSPLRQHVRGPGDEEDYHTPRVRSKRLRVASSSDDEEQGEKKRVKWHWGLATAVFLDEVEPHPRRPKENIDLKGCLAPTAKALRLDPLGNHPHAESPLKNLIEENVVVQKFVYDNDPAEEPELPVVEVVVKNTRSKSKKKS